MENLLKKDIATQVLGTMNRVYQAGLTTTSGGNISGMDSSGHIFITPSGIDKGSLTPADIAEVTPSGEKLGRYAPSMELPFHSNIYRLRPDIKGIVHAHAPAVVAYATAHKTPNAQVARCYEDILGSISSSRYDIPGSLGLGEIVKTEFAKGYHTVMMDNHGATVGAPTLTAAYQMYENLEYLSEALIGAAMLGAVNVPAKKVATICNTYPTFSCEDTAEIVALKAEFLHFMARSYHNKLISASFGTLAVRVGDAILFNPDGIDRGTLTAQELAIFKNGACTDKHGSIYLPLIIKIFETTKEANAVFISMPSATMSFAIAHQPIDSKLIPESYIMLKETAALLPYGTTMTGLDTIAGALSTKTPVALIKNECAITIGKNITKAFDRMEVLDYSARSIIKAKSIATIVPISQKEVDDINNTFNGW